MKKFIVITSIFAPTQAVKDFAKLEDWQLIVVGDQKTPPGWKHPGVTYLSPSDQQKLDFHGIDQLPWKSYGRKNVGYLYAMLHGADIIADTDDDNIPYKDWAKSIKFEGNFTTLKSSGFINIYKYFTKKHVWPRGYPLNRVLEQEKIKEMQKKQKVGVWQFLADEDPDVDAIYRLTNNTPIYFKKRPPLVLEKGTPSPFNSQNTFFSKEFFPLLYLPVFVTFRFTDILRGLIAQPLLWNEGARLGFGHATAIQKRNPHDYLKDFESEIPCYLYPEKVIEVVQSSIKAQATLKVNLLNAYKKLHAANIVPENEVTSVHAWLKNF